MSAVVINGGIVHYEAFGRGRPIIFLHGWLGSWRYWMQTMESLAIEHRVYALDLWGFGDSDKAEKRFSMDNYITLLDEFINNMGVENPLLVGHALGAGIALEYAKTHQIDKIVAISLPLDMQSLDRRLANYNQGNLLSKVFRWKPIPTKEIEQEAARAAENVIEMTIESFFKRSMVNTLKNVASSVLLIYGEKDDVVNSAPVSNLNGTLTNVRYLTLPAARHFPMLDESGKFSRLLKDFADRDTTLESLELKDEWRRRLR